MTSNQNQRFELLKSFENEEELDVFIAEMSFIRIEKNKKSQLMKCTICNRNENEHKMRVKYNKCSEKRCQNQKPCFKITLCQLEKKSQLFQSNFHILSKKEPVEQSLPTTEPWDIGSNLNHDSSNNLSQDWDLDLNECFQLLYHVEDDFTLPVCENNQNINPNSDAIIVNYSNTEDLDLSDINIQDIINLNSLDININDDEIVSRESEKRSNTNVTKNRRTIWKTGNVLVYKSSTDDKWFEYNMTDNVITHTYRQLSAQDDEVILYDVDRKFFIKPTSDYIYFGHSPDKVNRRFNDGNWIEFTAWKALRQNIYFRRVNNSYWEKCVNGISDARLYECVKSEGDEVALKRDGTYVRLNWRELLIGPSINQCKMEYNGSWSSVDIIRL